MKKVTLQRIADELGVTKVSVSKALKNQPGVGDELRRKILLEANEMGYKFKTKPGSTALKHLAFVLHTRFYHVANEDYYTRILSHMNQVCQENECMLSLYIVPADDIVQMKIPKHLGACDGIVVAGELPEPYLFGLCSLGLPLVMLDFGSPRLQRDCVIADNFQMGFAAAMHLIDKGHTSLGFLSARSAHLNVMDRFYGFKKALELEGLPSREDWFISNISKDGTYYAPDVSLPQEMPTAFVCRNDTAAYFLVQTLTAAGYRVPEDVSIISFDNTNLAEACRPPLTTFNIHKEQFARYAFELLANRIAGPDAEIRTLYIDTKLVERNSVRNIKGDTP
jgi:LacI family transcriptional regulator